MSEQNKAIVRRYVEAVWNQGNLALADEMLSQDYIHHDFISPDVHGVEAMKQYVAQMREAFPDTVWVIDDLIAEGDKVVMRFTGTGTHQGEIMGIVPEGKPIMVQGTAITRMENGKLAEAWDHWDALGLMRQIGAIPEPRD